MLLTEDLHTYFYIRIITYNLIKSLDSCASSAMILGRMFTASLRLLLEMVDGGACLVEIFSVTISTAWQSNNSKGLTDDCY